MVQLPNLSRHRAFTLVETIIALNLICWLIIIPSIDLGQQWQIQQEKLFLLKFQSNWNWSLKRAFLEKSNCVVEFNSAQHIITFRDYRPQTPNVNLTLPKTLNASLKRNNKLTIHAANRLVDCYNGFILTARLILTRYVRRSGVLLILIDK